MTTTDRHRIDIDRGVTRDKVAFPDPAAAPLGTDEEAGGSHTPSHPMGKSVGHQGRRDPVDANWEGGQPQSPASRLTDDGTGSLSPFPATYSQGLATDQAPAEKTNDVPSPNAKEGAVEQEPLLKAFRRPWSLVGLLLGLGTVFVVIRRSLSHRRMS